MQDALLSRPAATIVRPADTKEDVLAKLLQHGMETLENLSRITGWAEQDTQRALLSLIAAGRADCKNRNGRRMYGARVQ
jgi:predicted transcriptional regulator